MTWGFDKQPVVRWREDDLVELVEPLVYKSKNGILFEVPAGTVSNLESRPLIVPGFIALFLGEVRYTAPAAIVHDWLYGEQPVSRAEADALYFEMLDWLRTHDTNSSSWERGRRRIGQTLAWAALRLGGWAAWSAK